MPIPNMSEVQMRAALKEFEQALYNHEQWTENLYGMPICRLSPDERDVSANAHHNCGFGQSSRQCRSVALLPLQPAIPL